MASGPSTEPEGGHGAPDTAFSSSSDGWGERVSFLPQGKTLCSQMAIRDKKHVPPQETLKEKPNLER